MATKAEERGSKMRLPSKLRMPSSFVTYTAVLLTLPMLLGADDQDSETSTVDNRKRIEQMTQSERNHLKRNFVAYQELEPAARDFYRDFHDKLVKDAEDRPLNNMNDTLNDYIEWLNRISPYDRQKLREEKDVLKRLGMVRGNSVQSDKRIEIVQASSASNSSDDQRTEKRKRYDSKTSWREVCTFVWRYQKCFECSRTVDSLIRRSGSKTQISNRQCPACYFACVRFTICTKPSGYVRE